MNPWSVVRSWWRRCQAHRQACIDASTCQVCGCTFDWRDGCGCYYRAIREAAEQKDMIGRLTRWQADERARALVAAVHQIGPATR